MSSGPIELTDDAGVTRFKGRSKPAPGGGGGGGVQVATVQVASVEILALFDADVVLVPGVPGAVIVVLACAIVYNAGGTPYDASGGGQITAATRLLSNPSSHADAFTAGAQGLIDQAADQAIAQGYGVEPIDGPRSDYAGQDLVLFETAANPTLGDGTLTVTLAYFLATGQP